MTLAAVAVAWTLSFPGVTGAIVGARRPEQVDGWLPAASLELKEDDLAGVAAAVHATGILITMLADGSATEAVLTGPEGLLAAADPGLIWVQMSTVGVEWTARLAGVAARYGLTYRRPRPVEPRSPSPARSWRRAAANGHADDDLAAIYTAT